MKTLLTPSMAAGAYALTQRKGTNTAAFMAKATNAPTGFAEILEATVGRVADAGHKAETEAMKVAGGQPSDLVSVVTAVTESEAAMETRVAVRDRVVSAYEEIMRMPI